MLLEKLKFRVSPLRLVQETNRFLEVYTPGYFVAPLRRLQIIRFLQSRSYIFISLGFPQMAVLK